MLRTTLVLSALVALFLSACQPLPMADGSMDGKKMASEEMASEEMASDGEAMEGEATAMPASAEEQHMAGEAAKSDEMKSDDMAEGEMANGEMADGEMADDDMAEGDMAEGEMAEGEMMHTPTTFVVRIENVAGDASQLLAPGVWVVHKDAAPLFRTGSADAGLGLEALAEDGNPADLAAALADKATMDAMGPVRASGVFNTPDGSDAPGPLAPGSAYVFTVDAEPGAHLAFATMYVQSNDLFYAPDEAGIALFDADGNPVNGDVTDQVALWDAGTEANEEPGVGANQAPRQAGPDTGDDEMGVVRLVDDGFTYPKGNLVITVTPQ